MSGDDGEDFFVEFDEFVVSVAAHDGQQQCASDGLFLGFLELFAFGIPAQFDGVFELDEGGLFYFDGEGGVIDDLHHGHTET